MCMQILGNIDRTDIVGENVIEYIWLIWRELWWQNTLVLWVNISLDLLLWPENILQINRWFTWMAIHGLCSKSKTALAESIHAHFERWRIFIFVVFGKLIIYYCVTWRLAMANHTPFRISQIITIIKTKLFICCRSGHSVQLIARCPIFFNSLLFFSVSLLFSIVSSGQWIGVKIPIIVWYFIRLKRGTRHADQIMDSGKTLYIIYKTMRDSVRMCKHRKWP